MRHLDLFSGIGGFSLAASWVWGSEHEIVAFCEIDKFCQKVLKKHWPKVPIFDDIKELNYDKIVANAEHLRRNSSKNSEGIREGTDHNPPRENSVEQSPGCTCKRGVTPEENRDFTVDLITGGFPCQPFSVAGKRKGKEDDRALWPEYLRIIQEVRPRWIIGENVAGIINMELDTVLSDLEGEGYSCQTLVIPACAVNAPHRRDRVWIVANSRQQRERTEESGFSDRQQSSDAKGKRTDSRYGLTNKDSITPDSEKSECKFSGGTRTGREGFTNNSAWDEPWLEVATRLCRVDDGIPRRMDRVNRLKALGNAIVPQVAYQIMKAIKETDER